MKRAPFLLLVVALWGCSFSGLFAWEGEEKERKFSALEVTLSDMSKKITGYYGEQGQPIPPEFDEKVFITLLEKIYPDQEKVEEIKEYRIMAKAAGLYYSVVLCDRGSGAKRMEDFSCTLSKVDIRYWDKNGTVACEFEGDWRKYCE